MTDYQKRMKLLSECRELENAIKAKLAELDADDALSDDECDRLSEEAFNKYHAEYTRKWTEAFSLQFPKRRGWFADTFIASFGECDNRQLSARQTEIVAKYCVSDDATWQTGKTYCRAGDKMVTLDIPRYSRDIGYLTVHTI